MNRRFQIGRIMSHQMTKWRIPWLLVANGFNRAATILTQLMVGFLLVPEQVGTFAVAAALASMVSPFQSADHARLALQDPVEAQATAASLRNWLLMGSAASCVIAIGVLPACGVTVAIAPLACIALLSLLRVMANIRVALLSRSGRSAAIAFVSASEGTMRSLVLVGTALLGAGMWSLVFGEVAAVVSATVLLDRFEPGLGAGGFRLPQWLPRKLFATIGVCLLVGVETNVAAIAISQLCGAGSAGSFAFANRIAGQLTVLLLPFIAIESIPRLLAVRSAGQAQFRAVSVQERQRLLMIVIPLVALLALAGPLAMVQIWGERWRDAAFMLPWLSLSIGLRLGYAFAKAHLEALGAFSRIFQLSVLDTTLILIAIFIASLVDGAMAVVCALGCESALILTLAVIAVRSQIQHSFPATGSRS